MDQELKERVINSIRKEHGITVDKNDPMFAIVTANDMVLQEQRKQLNNIVEHQLIEMEQVTNNYLKNAKELLEKRLTVALKEAKKELEKPQKIENITETKTAMQTIIITLIIGFILGYALSLFIL
jgi:predicted N-formylglutamate amidohydrolase